MGLIFRCNIFYYSYDYIFDIFYCSSNAHILKIMIHQFKFV
jgi:hypothetical protein